MVRSGISQSGAGADNTRRAFNTRFIGETFSELRRVTWPPRQETMRLSIMVVAVAGTVGLFLGVVDIAFARIMDAVLGN